MSSCGNVITSDDIPGLREIIRAGLGTGGARMRALRADALAAIDALREDDVATHERLARALNRLAEAIVRELDRQDRLIEVCRRLAAARTAAELRPAMANLVGLLDDESALAVAGFALAALVLAHPLADQPAPSGTAGPADQLH